MDNDNLNDFEEHLLGTLSRDPDTNRDGLTDGWETTTYPDNNEYGATDPLNREISTKPLTGASRIYIQTHLSILMMMV